MFEIRVQHSFPAGHSLRNYVGKCANVHGHNYTVTVVLQGPKLNDIGLLLDFGDLKKALRALCERLDHQYLNEIQPFDELNPSAENIAFYIYEELHNQVPPEAAARGVKLVEVDLQETGTAWAVYRP